MTNSCPQKDFAARWVGLVVWGLPALAVGIGTFVGPVARTLLWTAALLVAGIACIANAARCGRLHCYFTGPLYLLAAATTLLVSQGQVSVGWSGIAFGVLGGTALAFALEWARGRYVARTAVARGLLLVSILLSGAFLLAPFSFSSTSMSSLNDLTELQARFNADQGAARIVLLLSPTCPYCVGGARWVQSELLEKHPDAKLKVYAVWFDMILTDSRWLWRENVLHDPRVVHFWDSKKVVGRWYEGNVTHRGGDAEWDAFFLYGPDVSWDAKPPEVVAWGRTILSNTERLRDGVDQLLNGPQ